MNSGSLSVMYVGGQERGRALQAGLASCGWHVYLPSSTPEALAMYIFYYPSAVIVDLTSGCTFAEEVYFHLYSLHVKPLLMIEPDAHAGRWESILPATASVCEIVMTLSRLMEIQPRRW